MTDVERLLAAAQAVLDNSHHMPLHSIDGKSIINGAWVVEDSLMLELRSAVSVYHKNRKVPTMRETDFGVVMDEAVHKRLDEIKARLGSLSPAAKDKLYGAVRTLIELDLPWLIERCEK